MMRDNSSYNEIGSAKPEAELRGKGQKPMTEQELKEKIDSICVLPAGGTGIINRHSEIYLVGLEKADQIIALIKEAGWISPTTNPFLANPKTPKEAYEFLARWAKANGYVQGDKVRASSSSIPKWKKGDPLADYDG